MHPPGQESTSRRADRRLASCEHMIYLSPHVVFERLGAAFSKHASSSDCKEKKVCLWTSILASGK